MHCTYAKCFSCDGMGSREGLTGVKEASRTQYCGEMEAIPCYQHFINNITLNIQFITDSSL